MVRSSTLIILFFSLTFNLSKAQSIETLRLKINKVLADKSAVVGVAIKGINPSDTVSINGNNHLPMQSVFKFHLALTVLHQVDQGKFTLDEKISIDKELIDEYAHLWSPLSKKYPNGAEVALSEILKYTIALSDNVGCDLLFNLVGGTEVVQSHMQNIGIKDISIIHKEIIMQAEWERQYDNWTTANASNQVLKIFFENDNHLLSSESYIFLLKTLKETTTGKKSIRGLLPEEAIIAHKTGHSGENINGLTGAINDIGIIFLPDGSYFYLSILVSDSMEDNETNQKIIAEIAKLTWEYFDK